MLCCSKGNDIFEEVIVGKSEPLLGNIHVDGSSAIVTAFVPGFVELGFIGSALLLVEAVPRCPFFHALYIMTYEMRGRVRLRRISGLALLRIPPIDHEFLLLHISLISKETIPQNQPKNLLTPSFPLSDCRRSYRCHHC